MSEIQEPHELPEGALPTDRRRPDGVVVYSLTAHALQSIDRYKWIRSEEAGHDVGKPSFKECADSGANDAIRHPAFFREFICEIAVDHHRCPPGIKIVDDSPEGRRR